jgi:hypothetical protein
MTQPPTEGAQMAPHATQTAAIGIEDRTPNHGCAGCELRWGGANTAHCSGCHRTFSGLTAFDKHRTGSHALGARECLPPGDAGLALLAGRKYECWGLESDGTEFWGDAA